MQDAHIYSPETEATAAAKRADHVLALASDVEGGKVSKVAAKLALAAGGYDPDFGELVDSLVVTSPTDEAALQLGVTCVARLSTARRDDEDIGQVLDRLIAGADDGAEVAS